MCFSRDYRGSKFLPVTFEILMLANLPKVPQRGFLILNDGTNQFSTIFIFPIILNNFKSDSQTH